MLKPAPHYVGRFAPSPTGPLHLGSLLTAVASYLDARANGGRWLVRMEDLDPPREQPGAAENILSCLQQHGLHWDGDVLWQSQRHAAYEQTLHRLHRSGRVFSCGCSRAQLAELGGMHRGICRPGPQPHALRFYCPEETVQFQDRLQGHQQQHLLNEVGDFVLKRKDGLYAYQLAVVVDDIEQGVNQIVRGSDLMDSTPRQIALYHALGATPPQYLHLPVLLNDDGQKLSKQNHAPAIDPAQASDNLHRVLSLLRQPPPATTARSCADILATAVERWSPALLPPTLTISD